MEKIKVCKLGGTGCKYWSEPCMHCTKTEYKENPELCSMYPSMAKEYILEEIEEGKKQNTAYLKKMKKASWSLVHDFVKAAKGE